MAYTITEMKRGGGGGGITLLLLPSKGGFIPSCLLGVHQKASTKMGSQEEESDNV